MAGLSNLLNFRLVLSPPEGAQRLPSTAKTSWRIESLISCSIWVGFWVGCWWFTSTVLGWRVGLLALVFAAYILCTSVFDILVLIPLKYRHALYLVTDEQVTVQTGALSVQRQTVPLVRVQNVTTNVGFIDRFFGLADVVLSTAGNAVSIPNVPIEEAERLRAALLERLTVGAEV